MGGVGELIGEVTGANKAAKIAGEVAMDQRRAAQSNVDAALSERDQMMNLAQGQSPNEIRALEASLNKQTANVNKQAKLFDALDPAIMEASKQALSLLQGQDAKALDPLKRQREQQRQKLLNTLREQLGPGAETSTAGIQALTQFDAETSSVMSNAQQQSIGQLFGMGQSGAAGRSGLSQSTQTLSDIFGSQANRRLSAFQAGSTGVQNARSGFAATAGAERTGELMKAQAGANVMGSIVQAGITGGASKIFGPPAT